MDQRKRKGWRVWFRPPDEPADVASSHLDPGQSVPQALDLETLLLILNKKDRLLLILREVHGFTYTEMADILTMPVGTVRSRLHTARKKIMKQIQHQGAV